MRVFRSLTSHVAPLAGCNIDTDQIIPAAFLKTTDRSGLGRGLFANWRWDPDGRSQPEFVLNQPEYSTARILLAGDNFGCGSSREHAAWALLDYGIEVVISTRFADIFQANAAKNGLVAATVEPRHHAELLRRAHERPAAEITVDLEKRSVEADDLGSIPFEIDPFARHCLLHGLDQLGFLLESDPRIQEFERRCRQRIDTRKVRTAEVP